MLVEEYDSLIDEQRFPEAEEAEADAEATA